MADRLITRGYSAYSSRLITMGVGSLLCMASLAVVAAPNAAWAIAVISLVVFGDTFYSASMFASIGDLFHESAAGRVTGLTGLSGGLGGILFPLLTGWLIDHYSYAPAFLIAGVLPLAGAAALFLLAPRLKPFEISS